MHPFLLVLAGTLLLAATAPAQGITRGYPIVPGATVRVTAPSMLPDRMTGTFVSGARDTLRIAGRGGNLHYALPFPAVERLEVSRGRQRMKWLWIGAGTGAVIGTLLGGEMAGSDTQDAKAWGRLGGLVLGAPAGAIAGAVLAPERWRDVLVSSLR